MKVVDVSSPANHASLTAHDGPDSLHVFSGFFSHRLVWDGFRRLAASQARLAVYSEAPEQRAATGWIKRLRGRMLAARWSARIEFILSIGGVGCEFFTAIGVSADKIVPFGYFVDGPAIEASPAVPTPPFRFVCAGQLIPRKGIDLLIEACQSLPRTGWHLDVYGDGPKRTALERLAARRGFHERVTFHGTIPHRDLRRALAGADCAVLPSRFDGWGMLVNEALGVGTPAICTNRCGSADLLRACGFGDRIVAPTIASLSTALVAALRSAAPDADARHRVRDRVAEAGSPGRGAHRFLETAGCIASSPTPTPRSLMPA